MKMSRIASLILALAASVCTYAADVITTVEGKVIEAKIDRIDTEYGIILFHSTDSLNTSQYMLPDSTVYSIQYENGASIVFTNEYEEEEDVNSNEAVKKMKYNKNSISYIAIGKRRLSVDEAYSIMGDNYDYFLVNRKKWVTSKPIILGGIFSTSLIGPILLARGSRKEKAGLRMAGASLMITGAAAFVMGVRRHHIYKRKAIGLLKADYMY